MRVLELERILGIVKIKPEAKSGGGPVLHVCITICRVQQLGGGTPCLGNV